MDEVDLMDRMGFMDKMDMIDRMEKITSVYLTIRRTLEKRPLLKPVFLLRPPGFSKQEG